MLDRDTLDTLPTADLADLNLRTDSLTEAAVMFIGYQRTKQISKAAKTAWEAGDHAAMAAEVAARRTKIIQGVLEEIWREYLPLRDHLTKGGAHPRRVADIGCGAGINDLFLHHDFAPQFTLIDIETTPDQYHGWAGSGAGYASLTSARALLEENGASDITAINPRENPEAMAHVTADLVTSLYSCGFHYPVDEYLDLFLATLASGGAVCLDLRGRYYRRKPPGLAKLLDAGPVTELYHDRRSVRVIVG